jgi:hypothetical protein
VPGGVSTFRDKGSRPIGTSQSKRPPTRTPRPPHRPASARPPPSARHAAAAGGPRGWRRPGGLAAAVASQYFWARTGATQVNLSQNGRHKERSGRRTALVRQRRGVAGLCGGRGVSISLDENRRYIGKSQPKRPPQTTQRPPHHHPEGPAAVVAADAEHGDATLALPHLRGVSVERLSVERGDCQSTCAVAVIESRWVAQPLAFAGELQPPRLNHQSLSHTCAVARGGCLAWPPWPPSSLWLARPVEGGGVPLSATTAAAVAAAAASAIVSTWIPNHGCTSERVKVWPRPLRLNLHFLTRTDAT